MTIYTHEVGPIQANCYMLVNDDSLETIIIDPGDDAMALQSFIRAKNLKPVAIIDTHGHQDHVGANDVMRKAYDIPVYIHKADEELVTDPARAHSMFFVNVPAQAPADVLLNDGDHLQLAGFELEILHTPGHTNGGVVIYVPAEGVCFTGDTLFKGTVGRTDLYGGNYDTLLRSLNVKMKGLPDDTVVYSGHGPKTTMKVERKHNPYLRG